TFAQLEPVHAFHVEVGQHHVDVGRAQDLDCLGTRRRPRYVETVWSQAVGERFAQPAFVVDDEDAPAHATASSWPPAGCGRKIENRLRRPGVLSTAATMPRMSAT